MVASDAPEAAQTASGPREVRLGESAVVSARLGRPRQYQSWSLEHGSQSVSPQRPHVDTRRWQKQFLQVAQTVTVLPCRQRKHMRTCGTETSAAVRVLPVASGVFTLLGPQARQLLMLLGRGTVCTVRERRKCVQFLLWCQHFP